jgi:porphobilinogen synthase
MLERPRRNRRSPLQRAWTNETDLSPKRLVYPVFLHEGPEDQEIPAMPGQRRLSPEGLLRTAEAALEAGVGALLLFPRVPEERKTKDAREALDPRGLVPRSLVALKQRFPELLLLTDVALDPYSSDGHDGLLAPDGRILNDATVELLRQQAVMQAEHGADLVAPSDMMDGRVAAIRQALDRRGFEEVGILSYCAKYASAFYGPFRSALDSAPRSGDKLTYQMDPRNRREALRELRLDEEEGADIVMVKPAGPYLDVIAALRAQTTLPVAAYQVSGEYSQLMAAAERGFLDLDRALMESLIGIRRAGADILLTYFALRAARLIAGG